MRYYELIVPCSHNNGETAAPACYDLEFFILEVAGGFTLATGQHGVWRDEETGTIYREGVRSYRVACEADTFRQIVETAFCLFPDQVAIFHALIGDAQVEVRS